MAETYEQVERQRDHLRGRVAALERVFNEIREERDQLQDSNRELTRQVEQLQARVDAAEKLAKAWRDSDDYGALGILLDCADQLQQALTAPHSSAPTDAGRADMENEK